MINLDVFSMTLFDGRYCWDGTKKDDREPITWYPGAYDLKIFDRADADSSVKPLKQYICIYSKTGEGQSISEKPEKFVNHICNDFGLDIEKVLWVEDLLTEKDRYLIVMFTKSRKLGDRVFYSTSKRKALEAEEGWIKEVLSTLAQRGPG